VFKSRDDAAVREAYVLAQQQEADERKANQGKKAARNAKRKDAKSTPRKKSD
jgi:hypothetical protein